MPRTAPDPILGATVRRLREDRCISRERLAFRAGITTGALARIELAQASPSWETFRRIASALNLPVSRLAAAVDAAEQER